MNSRRGFTIVETMIATAVFAVFLLILMVAAMSLARMYQKGLVTSQTQDAARSVVNSVSQAIQLAPGTVSTTPPSNNMPGAVCADTQQFNYQLNQPVSSTTHAVWLTTGGGCGGVAPTPLGSNGALPANSTELLGKNMRLTKFDVISRDDNTYSIDVRVMYAAGDDLLCSDSIAHSCDSNNGTSLTAAQLQDNLATLRCKNGGNGNEFCALSDLTTVVNRRVH